MYRREAEGAAGMTSGSSADQEESPAAAQVPAVKWLVDFSLFVFLNRNIKACVSRLGLSRCLGATVSVLEPVIQQWS